MAGPVAFTAAWVTSSLLQTGHSAAEVQISGLAAPDARDPWIMIAGFVVLGGCSAGFGAALHQALGGSGRAGPGPRLIQAAGVLTVAAGLLRRDQMLLTAPAGESWHNHAHDAVSALIYAALIVVPLLLARRFRGDRRWRGPEPAADRLRPGRGRGPGRVLLPGDPVLGRGAAADRGHRAARGPGRGGGAAAHRHGTPARPEVCRTGPVPAGRLW